ncbi:hypothetical protein [Pseudalkalibacillus caeni]|uniref:Lipoprotein n=1 Tax=Exobacillus caeni TaxID=2574798 RepID=A0A5R9FAT5_9BACL|nr:hypothetical protein [Pseudalkalibacillus caeni]TLS37654.1 hypothetical protein FCL54_07450 [Pseudalkalibacillus caeni]
MKLFWAATAGVLLLLSGCVVQKEPALDKSITSEQRQDEVPVSKQASISAVESHQKMTVNHSVRGNSVFIECIIPNFSFSSKHDRSYLTLYVDGKKVKQTNRAAFILKNMPIGKHALSLELFHQNGKSYGIKRDFSVTIK